jgi:hypothetical protein
MISFLNTSITSIEVFDQDERLVEYVHPLYQVHCSDTIDLVLATSSPFRLLVP